MTSIVELTNIEELFRDPVVGNTYFELVGKWRVNAYLKNIVYQDTRAFLTIEVWRAGIQFVERSSNPFEFKKSKRVANVSAVSYEYSLMRDQCIRFAAERLAVLLRDVGMEEMLLAVHGT